MRKVVYFFLLSLAACHTGSSSPGQDYLKKADTSALRPADTAYLPTGFYFLAEPPDGIRRRIEGQGLTYTLGREPFASAQHILKTEVQRSTPGDAHPYLSLCMIFDAEGTKALKEATGNPLHPQMAVVIANRLLYVVDNATQIKTGVMCVALGQYKKPEIEAMQKAISKGM